MIPEERLNAVLNELFKNSEVTEFNRYWILRSPNATEETIRKNYEFLKGKNLKDIVKMSKDDLFKLFGNNISSARIKCVMLPFSALKSGIYKHLGKEYREEY